MPLNIESFVTGPFAENIVRDRETRRCAIIDPGWGADELLARVRRR